MTSALYCVKSWYWIIDRNDGWTVDYNNGDVALFCISYINWQYYGDWSLYTSDPYDLKHFAHNTLSTIICVFNLTNARYNSSHNYAIIQFCQDSFYDHHYIYTWTYSRVGIILSKVGTLNVGSGALITVGGIHWANQILSWRHSVAPSTCIQKQSIAHVVVQEVLGNLSTVLLPDNCLQSVPFHITRRGGSWNKACVSSLVVQHR